ncbi:ATP-binding cassette domain-containing protein [Oceanicola sp. 502str15]|uniref:ATP-binding cassette domain-containing protein n=1 Tax=Oceanicola sp. 502str15 TaxID=2696061 RepID=UPI002096016C|nr:ATP-binding cassette domain-containing protein [Oceanicola sp. 502str15]MCO6384668.1 ATP-binding cassette domain-containing protein [Oceanicola sp. 502str15]
MIRIANLTVNRGEKPVLRDLSLNFGSGGITALIGPNGAGKSTLLHAIAGLLPADEGRVQVEGQDVAGIAPMARARLVALLMQTDQVTARLTVEDLVTFGRWSYHKGRPSARDRQMVADALAHFDLGDLAHRQIDTLSGGQRQRAFVAMAWAQETPWLLLDEPLAALDPRHVRDLMERLHAMSRPGVEGERSIIIVMHDLGATARYADRIIALKDGQIVKSGPRSLAMTKGVLSGLFETGLDVVRVRGADVVVPSDPVESGAGEIGAEFQPAGAASADRSAASSSGVPEK